MAKTTTLDKVAALDRLHEIALALVDGAVAGMPGDYLPADHRGAIARGERQALVAEGRELLAHVGNALVGIVAHEDHHTGSVHAYVLAHADELAVHMWEVDWLGEMDETGGVAAKSRTSQILDLRPKLRHEHAHARRHVELTTVLEQANAPMNGTATYSEEQAASMLGVSSKLLQRNRKAAERGDAAKVKWPLPITYSKPIRYSAAVIDSAAAKQAQPPKRQRRSVPRG